MELSKRSSDIDIENNIKRIDDVSLWEYLYYDVAIMRFFKITGFHYEVDIRDSMIWIVLAKIWLALLLIGGSIGFTWQTFIVGGNSILSLGRGIVASIDIFIGVGNVLRFFVTHILQVSSTCYSLYYAKNQLNQSVSRSMMSSILPSCKSNTFMFLFTMVLIVITIDPSVINESGYEAYINASSTNTSLDTNYRLYCFNFVTNMIYNLAATLYLSVVVLFTIISLKQVQSLQHDMIHSLDQEVLSTEQYSTIKEKIILLQKESYYSTQVITLVAGFDIIIEMFELWINYYNYQNYSDEGFTYGEMLRYDFRTLPFYLKDILFFFYVLWFAASINSVHDQFRATISTKCWKYRDNQKLFQQYSAMYFDCLEYPVVFRLGPFKVREYSYYQYYY